MSETYIISDTHFGHANSLTFKKKDGSPLREFASTFEMDEHMINQWNSVVKPGDKVIHLGDVVINKKFLPLLHRLNGKKKLIMGNHDLWDQSVLAEYFYDVKAYRVFDKHVFSHIPVHPESIGRFVANVHGHTHSNVVMKKNPYGGSDIPDPDFICMCVEQEHVNYTPVPWYRVKELLAKQR